MARNKPPVAAQKSEWCAGWPRRVGLAGRISMDLIRPNHGG